MTDNESLGHEITQWKQKYYSLLDDKEALEKFLTETESQLRRSLSHLSLASDGFDPAMDTLLRQLRNAIRDGKPSTTLPPLVEQILEISSQLEHQASAKQPPSVQDTLLEILDSLKLPRGIQSRTKALRKTLSQDRDENDPSSLIEQLTQLIHDALALSSSESGDQPGTTPKGLFSRLLGKTPPASVDEATTDTPGLSQKLQGMQETEPETALLINLLNQVRLPTEEQMQQLLELCRQLEAEPAQKELSAIIPRLAMLLNHTQIHHTGTYNPEELTMIQDILCQLLERLSLPTEFDQGLHSICDRLQGELEPQDLIPILEEIADLIAKAHTLSEQEKIELEGFLKNITQSLLEIDQHLLGTKNVSQQVLEDSRRLDDALELQVKGIEESVRTSTDLGQLRHTIENNLRTIRTHLEQFRDEEEQRYQQLDQEFQQLRTHLTEVEHEAAHLRDRIVEQHRQAMRDPLTGINNRLAYNERITQEYDRWKRYREDLTLLIWDIDNFKSVNDRFGHHAGDKAIVIIATLLSQHCRTTDFVARYGGEEFVILMPNTDLAGALPAAENLRRIIADSDFTYNGVKVPISISCGLAQFGDNDAEEEVFKRADAALYKAKQGGRNKCVTETALNDDIA